MVRLVLGVVLAIAACANEETGTDAGEPDSGKGRQVTSYVALGSSSTAGSGASVPSETGYVALLSARLEAETTLNLGAGGARIDRFLPKLDQIRAALPTLVTILPFTDYVRTPVDQFTAGYGQLLDGLNETTVFFGDLRLDPNLVCGTGSGPGGCYSAEDRDLLDEKNQALQEIVRPRSHVIVVPIIDQNVAHPEWIAADGAHPNDLGHRYFADQFWTAIEAWLD